MLGRYRDHKAAGSFGVQEGVVTVNIWLTGYSAEVKMHAKTASKGHLGSGNRQAAVGTIVAGTDEAASDGLRQGVVQVAGMGGIDLRYTIPNEAVQGIIL